MQTENSKNKLIKIRENLKEKFKKNNRIKKADRDCYEYEDNKFYDVKEIRYLFNQNDDYIYESIGCLFNESIIF